MKALLAGIPLIFAFWYLSEAEAVEIESVGQIFRQPDGREFRGRMLGDEYVVFHETEEGYSLAQNAGGFWCYAETGAEGYLRASQHVVGEVNPALVIAEKHRRHAPAIMAEIQQQRTARDERMQLMAPRSKKRSGTGFSGSAMPDAYKLAVLLIEFPDVPRSYQRENFHQLLFSENFTYISPAPGEPAFGSMRDYYLHASRGIFSLTGEVFDWVLADHDKVYYESSDSFIAEAIAKSGVDLSAFDGFAVVYAGTVGPASSRLWPHSAAEQGTIRYIMSEKWLPRYDFSPIGVHCHEFGHLLGLPDLYDIDFSSPGIGVWCLMSQGNYGNGHHERPFELSAWSKSALGWIAPAAVYDANMRAFTLAPIAATGATLKVISRESFFLLENRQLLDYDLNLPGAGLLIWHVDERFGQQLLDQHRLVDLEEADGHETAGNSGDPFPGTTSNTAFNAASRPSSHDYDGGSYVEIRDIRLAGEQVLFEVSQDLGDGRGITLNHAGNFPNLFTALEASAAGDSVFVPAGNFAANRNLVRAERHLLGAGAQATELNGEGDVILRLEQSHGASLSGFAFTNAQAAITLRRSQAVIRYNIFRDGNQAIVCNQAAPEIRNNTIINHNGAGITCFSNSAPMIVNNVILYNGVGIAGDMNSAPELLYNNFWNNARDYQAVPPGQNDVSVDPRFVNHLYHDYHLRPDSPCIDAGHPDSAYADPNGTRNDLGAFWFDPGYVVMTEGVRVNAGGSAYFSADSSFWAADQPYAVGGWGYEGGEASATSDSIAGTFDDALYQTQRQGMEAYRFEVPNGRYRASLHFCEIAAQQADQRVFGVEIEGRPVIQDYDIYARVGHDFSEQFSFFTEVRDGRLDVRFVPKTGNAQIAALAVIPASPLFIEVAELLKVAHAGASRGLALGDYDGDGHLDIFIADAGRANFLFRNNGLGLFTNATVDAGFHRTGGGRMAAWGDFDNDGDPDLYVVRFSQPNLLYRNEGAGFSEIAALAGVNHRAAGNACAWADYDNDGHLDLFVANDGADVLYRNRGNGTFGITTDSAGIKSIDNSTDALWGDFNNDGYADLLITRRHQTATLANLIYFNQRDGTFVAAELAANGFGACAGDYDTDADLDVFMITADMLGSPAYRLFQNDGRGNFSDVTTTTGIFSGGAAQGAGWGDLNGDGLLDLFVFATDQTNLIFQNNGDGTFTEVAAVAGIEDWEAESAVAAGDFDHDGDVDLYVGRTNRENLFYQNQLAPRNWLAVRLRGTRSNRDAIGARVRLVADGRVQMREVSGGSGFRSQGGLPVSFGLNATTMIDTLQIHWPSGLLERYVHVAEINRTLDLTEGTAVAVALRPETGAIRPLHFRLEQSMPNPLRPEHGALIRYALPERKEVTIAIYNLLGQKIVTLVNQAQPAGFHQVRWEGRNAAGFTAPAGLYFCVMRSGNFLARRKLVVLH